MKLGLLIFQAEEADTRLLFRVKHAAGVSSCSALVLRSSDMDVMVLAIYIFKK